MQVGSGAEAVRLDSRRTLACSGARALYYLSAGQGEAFNSLLLN